MIPNTVSLKEGAEVPEVIRSLEGQPLNTIPQEEAVQEREDIAMPTSSSCVPSRPISSERYNKICWRVLKFKNPVSRESAVSEVIKPLESQSPNKVPQGENSQVQEVPTPLEALPTGSSCDQYSDSMIANKENAEAPETRTPLEAQPPKSSLIPSKPVLVLYNEEIWSAKLNSVISHTGAQESSVPVIKPLDGQSPSTVPQKEKVQLAKIVQTPQSSTVLPKPNSVLHSKLGWCVLQKTLILRRIIKRCCEELDDLEAKIKSKKARTA